MKSAFFRRCLLGLGFLVLCIPGLSCAFTRGIYVTQSTLESTPTIKYLIEKAKATKIDTFVIDFYGLNKYTKQNIDLVRNAGLHYVARIEMFPGGATVAQVNSEQYLQKRYRQIMQAVDLGAEAIQLDYIRYKTDQRKSEENVRDIAEIVKDVKDLLKGRNVSLQIDIFGEAAEMHSTAIGQNGPSFAPIVAAICPMVYPSHYYPYAWHAVRPYETIHRSISMLKERIKEYPDVKVFAYIELFNLRYPLTRDQKINYILEEIRAVKDTGADGWFAWSANNYYRLLFSIMEAYPDKT